MKKILIVNNNMHIGGVQKALINLLWNIQDQYDVTLLLFADVGACLQELPPRIKVITLKSGYRYLGLSGGDLKTRKQKLARAFYGGISRVFGRKYATWLMALGQRKLQSYDVAISYLHNGANRVFYGGCNEFVLRHVRAKRKITFLHCDFQLSGANTRRNRRQYRRFDVIAACSRGCADSFLAVNPKLQDRVHIVYNCHRYPNIHAQAAADPRVLSGRINVVTVARLGKEKGVERALQVVAAMGAAGEKMHYYIVGNGVQRPLLEQLIREHCLEKTVTLCGAMTNPYGILQAADLLWIPSYSEAAPLVIGEAACLGVPVLSTCTSSAQEMIANLGYGWVCDNDREAMMQALLRLLHHPEQLAEQKKFLARQKFHNDLPLRQFYAALTED